MSRKCSSIEAFAARNLCRGPRDAPWRQLSEHEAAILEVVERVCLTAGSSRGDVTLAVVGLRDGPVHAAVSLDERWGGVERWLSDVLPLREEVGYGVVHAYGHEIGGEGVDQDALLTLIEDSQSSGWSCWVRCSAPIRTDGLRRTSRGGFRLKHLQDDVEPPMSSP